MRPPSAYGELMSHPHRGRAVLPTPATSRRPSISGRCSGGSCTSTPWGSEHAEQVAKRVLMAMARLLGFGEGFFLD